MPKKPKAQRGLPLSFQAGADVLGAAQATGPTLERLAELYRVHHLEHKAANTIATQSKMLRRGVEELPARPDFAAVVKWRDALACTLSEASVNQYLKCWSAVCEFGREFYPSAVVPNHFARVPRMTEPRRVPRALVNRHELWPRLLEAMPDDLARAFLCAMRHHGLRLSEALGLEPRHLDWKRGRLIVEQARQPGRYEPSPSLKSKNAAACLPMHPEFSSYLRKHFKRVMREGLPTHARSNRLVVRYVFPYYPRPLNAILAACREVSPESFPVKKAGRGGTAWHALRHTFGAALEETGLTSNEARPFMRHASAVTTEGYYQSIRGALVDEAPLEKVREQEAKAEAAASAARRGLTLVKS